ncbi:TRAP transporter fused permease subunit [uncultured Cohaesibacter sp.]|uniref:TRAP transporter permease n=1 Tax=uncultured Cohaesibacter sp. TaxID=1002546 RepID=UPI0029C86A7F|nr:TRAP transporter fused permease subunit [uncultured Cohaesibacter sp.]
MLDSFSLRLLPNTQLQPFERIIVALLIAAVALAASALVIHAAYFSSLTALLLRSMFFSLLAGAGLLMLAVKRKNVFIRLIFYALAIVALIPGPYLQQNYISIIRMGAIARETDIYLFVATVVVALVLARFYLGWTMVGLAVIALGYAMFGYLLPGEYGHAGYSLDRLTSNLFLRTEGLFSMPMGVAAEYILLFSLLGGLLLKSGLGKVFVDIAHALTGSVQGGPGLTAVVSSTMFSSINGSAVAGVVTTGTFTIPLMKRTGYRPKVAAAIEAAASSAGQIMPPVMGAAAFLMAEMTQIPYSTIAAAAAIPALLYVFALLVAVRLEAGKFNLERANPEDIPSIWTVLLKQGYMLLPLIALVGFLVYGFTPAKAAVLCILATLLLSPWRKETRISIAEIIEVCVVTVRNVMPIIAAVAVAGILIGVLTLTGLALQISSMILSWGGDSLLAVLILTMIASFILGMGMPTSAAYLLLAILVAPALVKFGLPILAGHMFIFYYGLLSAITPPVAIAAYAGASIAGSEPNETAIEAIRLGFVSVVAPFMFVYAPELLLIGSPLEIIIAVIGAFAAVFALGTSFAGWIGRPLSVIERLVLIVAGFALIAPFGAVQTDLASLGAKLVGAALVSFIIWKAVYNNDTRLSSVSS